MGFKEEESMMYTPGGEREKEVRRNDRSNEYKRYIETGMDVEGLVKYFALSKMGFYKYFCRYRFLQIYIGPS